MMNKRELKELEKENNEMESSLKDLIKIIELDDKILRYNSLIAQLQDIDESEKIAHIQAHLKLKDKRESLYKDMIKHISFPIEGHYPQEIKNDKDWGYATIQWILDSIDYEKTTCDMYKFLKNKSGQCYHISRFFKDVLNYHGIEATMVKGYVRDLEDEGLHVWNRAVFNGEEFYFDITFELTKDEENCDKKWIWLKENQIIDTHIPIYELE